MLYRNLVQRTANQEEFIDEELKMGLDAFVSVGSLKHSYHPDAKTTEWVEADTGEGYFRRITETPKVT